LVSFTEKGTSQCHLICCVLGVISSRIRSVGGCGKNNFRPPWNEGREEVGIKAVIKSFYVPYSQSPSNVALGNMFKFSIPCFEANEIEQLTIELGGLWTLPHDRVVSFSFQEYNLRIEKNEKTNSGNDEQFSVSNKIDWFSKKFKLLEQSDGLFKVTDCCDRKPGDKLMRYVEYRPFWAFTAEDAEELVLHIPPKLVKRGIISPGNWRRLMYVCKELDLKLRC